MNTKIIGGVVVAIAVIAGVYSYMSSSMNNKEMMTKEEEAKKIEAMKMDEAKMAEEKMILDNEAMMKDGKMMDNKMMDKKMDDKMMQDDKMMSGEKGVMMEKGAMMEKAGVYTPYAAEKIAMATTGDVVLFFKASWCPKCRGADADIKANLKNIPAGVTILDVDYDKYTDLKQKYGVTSQHTFVQVDAKGNAIGKWSGSNTLKELLSNVK